MEMEIVKQTYLPLPLWIVKHLKGNVCWNKESISLNYFLDWQGMNLEILSQHYIAEPHSLISRSDRWYRMSSRRLSLCAVNTR